MSDLDLLLPDPDAASDDALVTICPCHAVNTTDRLVRVGVRGEPLWLPAMPGRYQRRGASGAGLARVLLNPGSGRPSLVLGPIDPLDPVVPATLTAATATVATITWAGSAHSLPYLAGAYGALPAPVWVSLSDWGVPLLVLGPSAIAPPPSPPPVPTPPPPSGTSTVQVTQTIGPQWSGSWRQSSGRWGDWNASRYGGRSTLYQGNGFGSGPMKGLATYGDQLVNLGAISIDRVQVMLRGVGLAGASGPTTVQGSPHGSQPGGAPASSGPTATGDGWTDLDAATRNGMRTGAVKALALVGTQYWAVAGAGNGDGMALSVTYTRPA
ncbi:hypothetical protein [Oerskovia paurometabola]|uniref:Minor tail protein n=1 Tax=Oerskovia paurometabola TaxID=162170 RepID=A0ABW1X853_9CELL|nr:hypothetical protein [Oerskovia paurometabola]MBM7497815.1 hypothetical protein [Oerskovia paurometabola]